MNRFRLSAKLALAVIPIGLVALLAAGFIAVSFLEESANESESSRAATVTAEALGALDAIWDEHTQARQLYVFFDSNAGADYATAVEATDVALNRLESSISALARSSTGLSNAVATSASEQVSVVASDLERLRSVDAPTGTDVAGYATVAEAVVSLMPKFSSLVSDRDRARDLSTAYFLAEGGQVSLLQEQLIEDFIATAFPTSSATATSNLRNTLQSTLTLLERDFASWGFRASQTADQGNEAVLQYAVPAPVDIDSFPVQRNDEILALSSEMTRGVADESAASASRSEREAYLVAGVAAIVLLLALWGAFAVIRSIVRRVRGVTAAATQVSEVDLPNLVAALQNPGENVANLEPTSIAVAGSDEVGELAQSFVSLHTTLIDVAGQQMEILRRGVSEIFVTLARRNRSLVDRQLALLDELESREEDAETLGGYYKLDHLATRMRRNAESLLVLAGSEPTRVWDNPLDVSEIIRAALGEVDEYQRVDIMALEPALVSGRAVADIAHLMSELLDNGTQYSSPSDRVRVAGLFDPEGYMLTVSDTGIGVTDAKLAELNALLEAPPVLGLALQPTLGMYVVARLAARHGVNVQMISGSPGLTVRVLLPKDLIEPAKPKEDTVTELARPSVPSLASTAPFRPEPVAAYGSSRSGDSFVNSEDVVTDDEFELSNPNGSVPLPGSIVGKHEHPARQKRPIDDMAGDADGSGTEELARRVPGAALRSTVGESPVEAVAPVKPMKRVEVDESPWWAKDVSKDRADSEEPKSLWDEREAEAATAPPTRFVPARVEPGRVERRADPDPTVSESGLPVRTPGTSFKETDESGVSSAASESGAIGIKSALSSFAEGRVMAGGNGDDEETDEGGDG